MSQALQAMDMQWPLTTCLKNIVIVSADCRGVRTRRRVFQFRAFHLAPCLFDRVNCDAVELRPWSLLLNVALYKTYGAGNIENFYENPFFLPQLF